MKTLGTAIGLAIVFISGTTCFLLGKMLYIRSLGALLISLLLLGILASFVYTGQIQTNRWLVRRVESPATYWMNILVFSVFVLAMGACMFLAAFGKIPIKAPPH